MLAITREEFREIYAGLPIVDDEELFYSKPTSDAEILSVYLPSKLWRLNNIYKIVDKYGNLISFKMNKSQHRVYAASLRHPRLIILKSRQQGISTFWLVSFFDDSITRRHFSIGLMAQGLDESTTLLTRVTILWDNLDENLKTFLKIKLGKDNTKEFSLSNSSNIFIRTSFRSTTLQRLHISEMGKIANKNPDKAQETKTGTLQAIAQGNTAVIESTAEGNNMFKEMWDNAIKFVSTLSTKDFMPVFLSWLDDPDCVLETDQVITSKIAQYFKELEAELDIELSRVQKNFWVAQYRELGDKIYQEYPSTPTEAFMATRDGSYYAKMYMNHVVANKKVHELSPYDPNLDVQVAFDLGMNDTMSAGVFQEYMDEVRFIDEIYGSGEPIKYYTDQLKEKQYYDNITHLILPHDAEVKDLTSGKTRTETFEEEMPGIDITVLDRTAVQEGIEAVRQMLKNLVIWSGCEYIIECVLNYSKEWDEKTSRWKDKPKHDEFSNGADMVRYVALGRRAGKLIKQMKARKRRRQGGMDV